jgi:transcriptional regulator with XRE-family HTH domain
MFISKNIRYLRRINQHTQKWLADKLGKTPTSVGEYEKGRNVPPIEIAMQICDIYQVSLDELVGKDLEAEQYTTEQKAERTAPYNSTENEKLLFQLLKEKFKQVSAELKEKDLEAYHRLGLENLEDW